MTDLSVKTSSANINKLIKSVKLSADKYNGLVQDAIVAIVIHANSYQDCTGAARLLDAMPRSNRRQLVVDHFSQYSPINVQRDASGAFKASLRKPFYDKAETKPNESYRDYDIDGVRANNWFERPEAEKIPDVIDYSSMHGKLMTFLESQLKKADKCANDDDRAKAKNLIIAVRSAASAFNVDTTKYDNLKGTEWDDETIVPNLDDEAREADAVELKVVAA